MEQVKECKVLATRGRFDLIVCKEEGSLVFGLCEDGKVIFTENDHDAFYDRVGMVSGEWELWLATMTVVDQEDVESVHDDRRCSRRD